MEDVGKHIKIQIYGVVFDKLKDVILAERFLADAVEAVGMRTLDDPWCYDIRQTLESKGLEPYPDEPEGVSGIVVLSTSHAAIATWPHRGYAIVDIFSCTDFETARALGVVDRYFAPKHKRTFDHTPALRLPPIEEAET